MKARRSVKRKATSAFVARRPESVRVNLGDRSYDIMIGSRWIGAFGREIRARERKPSPNAMVFTSPRIGGLHFKALAAALSRVGFSHIARHDIPDGERSKNLGQFRKGMEAICRHFNPDTEARPVVVALGGGVIGDISGFIAGTYGRGNGAFHVQVPTTLLACVDSSVGGKVGVDVLAFKNQAGLFFQPRLVLVDLALLDTLAMREFRSGLAEVVKYGAVCDRSLFELLEMRADALLARDPLVLRTVVARCCGIKARIVERDERDLSGRRMVLNFGHTIGHAIETASGFGLRHGEAVAIGMLGAARLAVATGACDASLHARLQALVRRLGLPVSAAGKGLDVRAVMAAMAHDKKFRSGANCFVLPAGPGRSRIERGVRDDLVRKAVASCL